MPNARVLTAEAGVLVSERIDELLPPALHAAALAAADAAIVVVSTPGAGCDAAIAALLAAGAFATFEGERLVTSGSAGAFAAARDASGGAARDLLDEVLRAVGADRSRPERLRLRDRTLAFDDGAKVMGILNVTPDSFYDAGAYRGIDNARARAAEMVALGAHVIDIGGQSYAHWNPRIAEAEERQRVVPVVEALVRDGLDAVISVDTFKSGVAEAALAAGAHLINDCSGLADERLAGTVARYDAGLVVMHLKGELNVRVADGYRYDDALGEIVDFLRQRTDVARADGVAADALLIDPGLEFGKEPTTDLEILERFGDLRSLGYPIVFAASRKSFIGRVFDRPAKSLLVPSLATAALAIAAGAGVVRVHDVEETAQLATMLGAIRRGRRRSLTIAASMPGTPA